MPSTDAAASTGAGAARPTLASDDPLLREFAEEVGALGPVAVAGARTRWSAGGDPTPLTRLVQAPAGVVDYSPEEMTVRVRAGTTVEELHLELAARGQRTSLPERGGTVGGAIAVGENHPEMLGRGRVRAGLLQVRYVSAEGRIVNAGGPTVKNVTGFDLPRLFVGSLGTLGLVAEVILRTDPLPTASIWLAADGADPFSVRNALLRPGAVFHDASTTWVLLEGHPEDLRVERRILAGFGEFTEVDGPPPLPGHRWSLRPSDLRRLDGGVGTRSANPGDHGADGDVVTGRYVAAVGTGLLFAERPQPPRAPEPVARSIAGRVKANFDPTGRLNPGRDPSVR